MSSNIITKSESYPFYKEIGCHNCHDKKAKIIMVHTKYSNSRGNENDITTILCPKCSGGPCSGRTQLSPPWIEYFNSIKEQKLAIKQQLKESKQEARQIISKAKSIDIDYKESGIEIFIET